MERVAAHRRRAVAEHYASELDVECEAHPAYEAYRARGVMKNALWFGGPPKPYVPPAEPEGKVNLIDPDCKNLNTAAAHSTPSSRAWAGRRTWPACRRASLALAGSIGFL